MQTVDFEFFLPPDRIAAAPADARDDARLLVMDRRGGARKHLRFRDISAELPPRSLLVLNDARVLAARLRGRKPTGGAVEFLLTQRVSIDVQDSGRQNTGFRELWEGLARGLGGTALVAPPHSMSAAASRSRSSSGARRGARCSVWSGRAPSLLSVLDGIGELPLPPYIEAARKRLGDAAPAVDDRMRYQTVYAASPGAVAAPTAGLHFTAPLLAALAGAGHEIATITLDVGPGTFRPVEVDDPRAHRLDPERYRHSAGRPRLRSPRARREGRPVVAVGTTVVRTLEAAARAAQDGAVAAGDAETDLCLLPGDRFQVVTDLITNFHLPRSTLLMLVAAFAGREQRAGGLPRGDRTRLSFLQLRRRDADPGRWPMSAAGTFRVVASAGRARAGLLQTAHGVVETPVFMPVGTQATVKALSSGDLDAAGRRRSSWATRITWRCAPARSGSRRSGGLHKFMSWPHAILTDSGGYQVFSLRERRTVDDDGVTFRSHLDGSEQRLTPERAMAIQAALASDIAMAFDECPPSDAPRPVIEAAMARTTRWARRCAGGAGARRDSCASASCRAASHLDLRRAHLADIAALPFDGLALGGLGVGEAPEVMYGVIDAVAPEMPAERPRYLMGVGTPEDIWTAIGAGIDMFDCVMPTRNARNGQLFVRGGRINIANAQYRDDAEPGRGGVPVRVLRVVQPRLSVAPVPRQGAALPPAGEHPQPRALPGPGAARARGDRRRGFSPVAVVVLRAWRSGWECCSPAAGASTAATSRRRCSRCWSIERAGAQAICAAPDANQAGVVDHLTGEGTDGVRNARAEAARIGPPVVPLSDLNTNDDRRADRPGRAGADRDAVRLPRQARALSGPPRRRRSAARRCCSRTGRWASSACRRCSRRACWGRWPACA